MTMLHKGRASALLGQTFPATAPRFAAPSGSLGVCPTNTAHLPTQSPTPPLGRYRRGALVALLAWVTRQSFTYSPCLSLQTQTPSGSQYGELSLVLRQSAIFTSPLRIFLIMFLPADHEEKPGFPRLP